MGKPVRIVDMAKTLIRLSGIPEHDVKIEFTGLRPGEKLFEELFYDFEKRIGTDAPKVFRSQGKIAPWPYLQQLLAELRSECATGDAIRIRSKVKEIVPEYAWEPKEPELRVPAPLLYPSPRYADQAPAIAND
jgi:FlaA1/EpsC-like NDP-sugar epimerase